MRTCGPPLDLAAFCCCWVFDTLNSPRLFCMQLIAPPPLPPPNRFDQFPEGSGGAGGGERYQPLGFQGRQAKRSLTPSMNYNQISAGWSDFAEAIDSKVTKKQLRRPRGERNERVSPCLGRDTIALHSAVLLAVLCAVRAGLLLPKP